MTGAWPAQPAIDAFERVHGVLVTVHDRSGHLAPLVDPACITHRHPRCVAAKVTDVARCVAFDVRRTADDLGRHPQGRAQRCWAGIIEWVVPVVADGTPIAVLFAGPGHPRHTSVDVDDSATAQGRASSSLDATDGTAVLECLRQLAARLGRLVEDALAPAARQRSLSDPIAVGPGRRREAILAFIEHHHLREVAVADLAHVLRLSVSRTIHAVRECCGQSFVTLLRDKRLEAAAAALRHSDLDVLSIATRSGFGDISHFHRSFRRRFGVTPLRYRARAGA